jgi:aryl-alcohol dehydrogenase-like predicted oxidoreductase
MEFRRVGSSGLVVSAIGLGCNAFGRLPSEPNRSRIPDDVAEATLAAALDAGVTLFDTSDSYGNSERLIGRFLKHCREDVVIATKFGQDLKGALGADHSARGGRRYVRRAVERSLRRLDSDWIDLYQMHFPDPATPIEETLDCLSELVREGKVRYLGSSNFSSWQVAEAEWSSRTRPAQRFVAAQNRHNLLAPASEILEVCQRYNIGLIPSRPLAEGVLAGTYRRGQAPPTRNRPVGPPTDLQLDTIERLAKFAADRELDLLSVAIGGLLGRVEVSSVIAGASGPDQVRSNVRAGSWRPSEADRRELEQIAAGGLTIPGAQSR